jgi:rhamnosyltransferase
MSGSAMVETGAKVSKISYLNPLMAGQSINGAAGVVILYHPDQQQVLVNMESYLPYLEKLYIIDNTGTPSIVPPSSEKVIYLVNSFNEGIGSGLNKAASLALAEGFSWLLTMDQDSYFEAPQAVSYFEGAFPMIDSLKEIAIASPNHGPTPENMMEQLVEVTATITSGSLIRLSVWEEVGGFDPGLFIDEVDHEYCYRVQLKGYKVVKAPFVQLSHQLGTLKMRGYLGVFAKRPRIVHNPQRVYYMVRNFYAVRDKYRRYFPAEFKSRETELWTMLKNNLMFSGKFISTLEAALKGYRDFKHGRMGPRNYR